MVLVRLLPLHGCDARRLVCLRRQLDTRPLHSRRSQVLRSPWPSCTRQRRVCAGTEGLCWNRYFFCWIHHFVLLQPLCFLLHPHSFFMNIFVFCWNWCPCLLQPAGVCATRSVPRRGSYIEQQGVLYPTPFEHRELQSCTPELQPAAGGAAREGGNFLLMHFLLNQFFVFAGTGVFFCWNQDNFLLHRLQSSQMLMSFLLAPKFVFARSIF